MLTTLLMLLLLPLHHHCHLPFVHSHEFSLSLCPQVFIEIENENDNVPLTELPVYYPLVYENSTPGTKIIHLNATDDDKDSNQKISFRIISGNPEGFFAINSTTGKSHELKLFDYSTVMSMS